MKKEIIISSLLMQFLFFVTTALYSLAVGSNTTPSRQGFTIFPSGATDNAMIGFASFENGFKITDNGTSCSFDGLLPVSGPIDFNGGNLYLMESLIFSNTTQINTMGNIYGNGKTIKLGASIPELRSTSTDLMVMFASYYTGAQVNSVDYAQSSSYVVAVSSANAGGSEVRLLYFDGATFTLTASVEYGRTVNACRWQAGTNNFAIGTTNVIGSELIIFSYKPWNGSFSVAASFTLSSVKDVNAVAFSPGGNYLLTGRNPAGGLGTSNQLFMHAVSSTGSATQALSQALPGGTVQKVSINAMSWSPGGNYIAIGTNPSGVLSDFFIYHWSGTTLTATIQLKTGFTVRGVDWSPSGTFIAVAFTGSTTQNVMIYTHNISNGTLTPKTSAHINQSTDVLAVAWTSDGNELGVGTSTVGASVGAFRKYSFDKTATTLSLIKSYSFAASVNALQALPYNNNYILGIDNSVYILTERFANGLTLTFDNLTMQLSNDLTWRAPIGIKGRCAIIGNNHTIDFDLTGTMIVLPQASLYLKDITLRNFGGTQLRCLDNTATISLDNVRFIFNSPYFFDAGTLNITNNFEISGTNPFIYRSTASSIIYARSSWNFDVLSTLSYAPRSNNRQGIQLFDQSSTLAFNNATLYMTTTGLILTKGQLLLDGEVTISSDAISTAQGFMWGDGISSQNDLSVRMMPHARIDLKSGFIVNRNIIS
jgi:hypothetical protein